MTTSKPTFVVVLGDWHSIPHYSVIGHLEAAGHPVQTISLHSLNPGAPSTADCCTDADAIRSQLLPLIEADGKEVVLIRHSYGGIPDGGAAKNLSKSARAKEGNLYDYLGGKHAPWVQTDQPSPGFFTVANPIQTFYRDVDPKLVIELEGLLLPHAQKAFEIPAPSPAWAEQASRGRLAFLKCMQDQAFSPVVQDMFLKRSGTKWIVKEIEPSHSPYASQAQKVTEILLEWVKVFEEIHDF